MSLCTVWEFRCNRDMFDNEHTMSAFLHKIAKKFCFQLEKGETTGYEHWQGRLSLFKKKRKPELMKMIEGMDQPLFNYLEPTTNQEHQRSAFYCMKEDTRLSGPFKDTDKSAYIPRQYRNINLYSWQQSVIDSANIFNNRQIDCIIDLKGCNGKSTLASIGDLLYKFIDLPLSHDGQKLIESTCDIMIAKDCRDPRLVFFDMPRAFSKEKMNGIYTALETIKKGKVWDMRHSYKEWWFDSPRIWIFSNEYPDESLLSRDRWKFWEITDDKRIEPFKGIPENNKIITEGCNAGGKYYKDLTLNLS